MAIWYSLKSFQNQTLATTIGTRHDNALCAIQHFQSLDVTEQHENCFRACAHRPLPAPATPVRALLYTNQALHHRGIIAHPTSSAVLVARSEAGHPNQCP